MNWYKEYCSEWKEIIETVARELGRSEQMIEKDTIQSMYLYELAKSEMPFVFKGGTSLSKAYDLIDRFSEDIDLSMDCRPTQSERAKSKGLIISIAENLGLILSNPGEIKSRYDYNKYVFKYDSKAVKGFVYSNYEYCQNKYTYTFCKFFFLHCSICSLTP